MNPKTVIKIVCSFFGTTYDYEKMHSNDRHTEHLIVRYYCFTFLKETTSLSLAQIGMLFDQDHATVLNGLEKLQIWMETDLSKKKIYDKISSIISKHTDNKVKTIPPLAVKMIYRRLKNPSLCVAKHKIRID